MTVLQAQHVSNKCATWRSLSGPSGATFFTTSRGRSQNGQKGGRGPSVRGPPTTSLQWIFNNQISRATFARWIADNRKTTRWRDTSCCSSIVNRRYGRAIVTEIIIERLCGKPVAYSPHGNVATQRISLEIRPNRHVEPLPGVISKRNARKRRSYC